jgi:hypothetical protein
LKPNLAKAAGKKGKPFADKRDMYVHQQSDFVPYKCKNQNWRTLIYRILPTESISEGAFPSTNRNPSSNKPHKSIHPSW